MEEQLDLFEIGFSDHRKFIDGVFKTKEQLVDQFKEEGRCKIYHVLSFGGGTQSTHLLEQHLQGQIHYDYVIFADTGAEPQFIHEQVAWWRERQKVMGNTTPFLITHHKSMERGLEEMLMRYLFTDYQRFQLPVYCNKADPLTGEILPGGLMPRQCTVDFKIVPVKQLARQMILKLHGLGPRQKMPDHIGIIMDIGFSLDEIRRVNTYQSPQYEYIRLAYPLIEENLTTQESIDFLNDHGFPKRRSRCYLCPFNCSNPESGMDWREIIREEPFSFIKACWFDEQLRTIQATGSKMMRSIPYLHFSRRPLKDVYPEYAVLSQRYKSQLKTWLSEWEEYITNRWSAREATTVKNAG
ncbi:hypothetical protein [Paenibacillus illinoisensis]|uniref:hypothetical protein n=1 Tax=Paenibacillus illinoisensis TaxID=59845 RepID=UPI00301BD975